MAISPGEGAKDMATPTSPVGRLIDSAANAVRLATLAGAALVLALSSAAGAAPGRLGRAAGLPDSVEIVARGNEPFWAVTVSRAGMVFRDPGHPDGLRFPYAPPEIEANRRVFRSVRADSAATALEVAIEPGPCRDGMSDESYALTARARLGRRKLVGCALERRAGTAGIDRRFLLDGEYPLACLDRPAVQLADGAYESNDSLDPVAVRLLRTTAGDLDGDGIPDAAVVLATNTGGSGTFICLLGMFNRRGRPAPSGEVLLGDRTPVDSLSIAGGEFVAQSPSRVRAIPGVVRRTR